MGKNNPISFIEEARSKDIFIATKIVPAAYFLVNTAIAAVSGFVSGYYNLEKNGRPYSAIDVGISITVPSALQAIETMTLDFVDENLLEGRLWRFGNDKQNAKSAITSSNLLSFAIFNGADFLGRYVASIN